jgi:hypothetical protein
MNNSRENFIPKGLYCYDKEGLCPHYEAKIVDKNIIKEAFCHFKASYDLKLNDKEKVCNQVLS